MTIEMEKQTEERPTILVARSPDEMVQAQAHSISFMEEKVAFEERELQLKRDNLDAAKEAEVKMSGWEREVKNQEKRVLYYTKVLAALREGYCIIPDFPIGLIAVRTDKDKVRKKSVKRWQGGILDVQPAEIPAGEGKYVDPEPKIEAFREEVENANGSTSTVSMLKTTGDFNEVDLPIRLVRPEVISELSKALKDRIFDEIGILPDVTTRTPQDPMIVGRIRGAGRTVSFLITWWIDPRTV